MVVIKPQEIKILCMQTHIPSQEKPEALCSGENLHIHRHIHSVPLCVRNTMQHKSCGLSAHYHLVRLSSTSGGFQETCPWKFRHLVVEKDNPSSSLRKKYSCYVKASRCCCKWLPKALKSSFPVHFMLYIYAIAGIFNESSVFEHLGLYFMALWALGMDVVSSFVFWGFTRSTERQF